MLQYNYRTFRGVRMTRKQVDEYNAIQKRIKSFRDEDRPVPVELLNGSHSYFAMVNLKGKR